MLAFKQGNEANKVPVQHHSQERNLPMKTLATLALLSVLFLAAVLPGSAAVGEAATDMLIAGKAGAAL
jgi:hypothetical protein